MRQRNDKEKRGRETNMREIGRGRNSWISRIGRGEKRPLTNGRER